MINWSEFPQCRKCGCHVPPAWTRRGLCRECQLELVQIVMFIAIVGLVVCSLARLAWDLLA